MNASKLKITGNALLSAGLLLAVLVVINLISNELFVRVDLSENKIYSMSDSTKKTLKELEDVVSVKAYFTENLPHQLTGIRKEVKDILDEYKAYSDGNVAYGFIDPSNDDDLKQKLRFTGIPELRVNVVEKDKAEIMNVYLGMTVNYGDKQEVIPVIRNTVNIEYDLTSAILKVTSDINRKIGIYTGPMREDGDYDDFISELRKQYEIQSIDPESGMIPEDIMTLIVAGPEKSALPEEFVRNIDRFIMKGGKAVFLIDKVSLMLNNLSAAPAQTGVDELLASYGFKVENNLVLDGRSNIMASFRTAYGFFSSNYPFWVKIANDGLHPDSPIVREIESIALPWASSVSFTGGDEKELIKLAVSSEDSWTQSGSYQLNPQQRFFPTGTPSKYDMALLATGRFESHSGDSAQTSPDTSIAVIGDSDFISRDFAGRSPGNMIFMLNLVDWMTFGDSLIHIRSRLNLDRPLDETSENERLMLKIFSVLAVPFLLIIFGITRWLINRKAKRDHELYMSRR